MIVFCLCCEVLAISIVTAVQFIRVPVMIFLVYVYYDAASIFRVSGYDLFC